MPIYIALIELKRYLRDPAALAFSLALPVALLALMLGAFGGDPSFRGEASIVDLDDSAESSQLIRMIDDEPGMKVELLDEAKADRLLDGSSRLLVTVIHRGYGQSLAGGDSKARIEFRQRGSGGDEGRITASIIRSAAAKQAGEAIALREVRSAASGVGLEVGEEEIRQAVRDAAARESEMPIVSVRVEDSGDAAPGFNTFFPGILTMMVMFAVTVSASAIVEERQDGRLERLLTTRLGATGIFLGKFLAGLSRGFLQAFLLATLGWAVFRSFTPLDYGQILLVCVFLAACAASVGMTLAAITRTRDQANWSAVVATMVMATIGGSFFEPAGGGALDAIGRLSPVRYANDALKGILSGNSNLGDLGLEIGVLAVVSLVLLVVSRRLFSALQKGAV